MTYELRYQDSELPEAKEVFNWRELENRLLNSEICKQEFIGCLHTFAKQVLLAGRRRDKTRDLLERAEFYLKVFEDHPNYSIRKKALQMFTGTLLDNSLIYAMFKQEAWVFMSKILDFLTDVPQLEEDWQDILEKRQFRHKIETFLLNLYANRYWSRGTGKAEELSRDKKPKIAKALVINKFYDKILTHKVYQAIEPLEEMVLGESEGSQPEQIQEAILSEDKREALVALFVLRKKIKEQNKEKSKGEFKAKEEQ